MFPDQRAVIVLSSAALSMICCGCASRGSYDQLEPQSDSWDDVETLLARSAKPLVAGKGDLVCSIDSGTEKWDLVLFPMGDGTARFADLEVRVEFKDLRVRTADEDASYGLRALRLPGVSVTPGDRLRLLFYDIDDVFHERMDDVSVSLEGSWPVAYAGDNVSGRCVLLTPAELNSQIEELRAKITSRIDGLDARFTPELGAGFFGYDGLLASSLRNDLERLRAQGAPDADALAQRFEAAENRWIERARALVLDKMRSAPAVGESVAIDRGGLVVTASEAACANKVAGAGVAFGVPRESADGIVTSCLVALTLRNSGTAPVRVGVTPHASRYVNRLEVAAPADATPTDLELGAYSRDGLDAEPIVYAARHGDRLIYYSWDRHVDRPRLDATLAQGDEIRLLVGFDNDRPNGPDAPPSLDRRASPIVLMHVGGTFWRTLPLDQ